MASVKPEDEERLLGAFPDPDPLSPPAQRPRESARCRAIFLDFPVKLTGWLNIPSALTALLISVTIMLVLYLLFFALVQLDRRVSAALSPPGHGYGEDPLNPYPDGRTLHTVHDRFKIVLFSDLHYGERGANNSWVAWADEAVSVLHPSQKCAGSRRGVADPRTPRAPR